MAVLLGYGYHGLVCGACGSANTMVETVPDIDGVPAVLLTCWSGCVAVRPRAEVAATLERENR